MAVPNKALNPTAIPLRFIAADGLLQLIDLLIQRFGHGHSH
jgi:hypothetical protein